MVAHPATAQARPHTQKKTTATVTRNWSSSCWFCWDTFSNCLLMLLLLPVLFWCLSLFSLWTRLGLRLWILRCWNWLLMMTLAPNVVDGASSHHDWVSPRPELGCLQAHTCACLSATQTCWTAWQASRTRGGVKTRIPSAATGAQAAPARKRTHGR